MTKNKTNSMLSIINKANLMLGIIDRGVAYKYAETISKLYISYVRPH